MEGKKKGAAGYTTVNQQPDRRSAPAIQSVQSIIEEKSTAVYENRQNQYASTVSLIHTANYYLFDFLTIKGVPCSEATKQLCVQKMHLSLLRML